MSIEELEAEALRLDPKGRARLAGRLLESLDDLTPDAGYLKLIRFSDRVNQAFYKSAEQIFKQPLSYFSIKELIKPLKIKGLVKR